MRSSIKKIFNESVKRYSKNILLQEGMKQYSYEHIAEKVYQQKKIWRQHGLQKRHRVILQYNNSKDLLVKILACWDSDLVCVPMHPEAILDREKIEKIGPFLIDRRDTKPIFAYKNAYFRNPLLFPEEEELGLIMMTSGTISGVQKAVPLSHSNILSCIEGIQKMYPEEKINESDSSFAFLPWYHIYGLVCELLFLMSRGGKYHVAHRDETVHRFIYRMKYCNPSLLFTIPKFLETVHQKTENAFLIPNHILKRYIFGNRIRMISSGGGFLPDKVYDSIHKKLNIELYQGYGMTECSPMISLETDSKCSLGNLLPEMKLRLNSIGEAEVSGKGLFHGYLGKNNKLIRPTDKFTNDGWFKTGDVLSISDNSDLHYEKRCGIEFKLTNGRFVDPILLEEILMKTGYFDCVVIIPDKKYQKTIMTGILSKKGKKDEYYIIPKANSELIHHNIEKYMLPSSFIPLTKPLDIRNETLTIKMEPNRHNIRNQVLQLHQ